MKKRNNNNVVSVTLDIDTNRAHSHGDPNHSNNFKHWNNEMVLPWSVNICRKSKYISYITMLRGKNYLDRIGNFHGKHYNL